MLVVLTTTTNLDEAESLTEKIISLRLAACVQILPKITSVYYWEGEVKREREHLLLIKTLPEKWNELHDLIIAEHSYAVPEIVALNAAHVSEPYLQWINKVIEGR